jgi:hypothetical protein
MSDVFTPTLADMTDRRYGVLIASLGEDGEEWIAVGTPDTPVTIRRALAAVHWFTRVCLCGPAFTDADDCLHDDLASGRWVIEQTPTIFVRAAAAGDDAAWIAQPVPAGTPGAVPAVWLGGAW